MRLVPQHIDMRGNYPDPMVWNTNIVDEDSGDEVGTLVHETRPAKRTVSLFGGRYKAEFKTAEEYEAFLRGVEAVYNHAFG